MRVLTLVIIAVVVALIGGVVASFMYRLPPIWGWYQQVRGYGPATKPEEAIERFVKACGDRDYETAADFCTSDGAHALKASADAATKLAKAIDDLEHNIKLKEINSPKAYWVLNRLQPMPKLFKKPEVKKVDDSTYYAFLYEDYAGLKAADWNDYGGIDRDFFRALSGGLFGGIATDSGFKVFIVKDGEYWKVKWVVPADWQKSMDNLRANSGNYVKGLEVVKYELKNHSVTKDELESQLKREIESAKPSSK
jgi:hypothetical protein